MTHTCSRTTPVPPFRLPRVRHALRGSACLIAAAGGCRGAGVAPTTALAVDAGARAVAASPAASAPSTSDRAAIGALLRDLGTTFAAGDEAGFLALLTEDAVWLPPDRPAVSGRAAIGAWFRESQATLVQQLTFAPVDVQVHNNWAIAQTQVTGTVARRAGGVPAAADNKAFFVLRRGADGGWRLWRDVWNRNQPPAPR
jgi:uncharacterized protein (TIGR02246 family)